MSSNLKSSFEGNIPFKSFKSDKYFNEKMKKRELGRIKIIF